MKQILVFIFDGYADWEPAYVCAQLNAPGTGYAVKTIGLDRAPKVSMGGFRVTPDFTVADYPRDAGLLLLTAGQRGWSGKMTLSCRLYGNGSDAISRWLQFATR